MTQVFALGSIPAFSEVEAALTGQYAVKTITTLEALAGSGNEKGVVLLGGDLDKIATWVGTVRTTNPQMAPIAVLTEEQLDNAPDTLPVMSDILVVPFHPKELMARVNTAILMSDLRHLLEASAQMDEITELYNHQYFVKRLGEEMSLAKRHLSPVSCVVIGVAFYEVFLDSYGYQFITDLLRHMAHIIQSHVRREDIIARLGDNEIAMLLPRSTEKGALSLTRRIIERLEAVPMQAGDQDEHLHLSAGIASFPLTDQSDVDPDTLIRYARHALHTARCSDDDTKVLLFSEMRPHVG